MQAAELRARISRIAALSAFMLANKPEKGGIWDKTEWNIYRARLGWGYIPAEVLREAETGALPEADPNDQRPLSTTELLTFDTYFTLYPGRVLGEQTENSALAFPLLIKSSEARLKQQLKVLSEQMDLLESERKRGLELSARLQRRQKGTLAGLEGLGELSPDESRKIEEASESIRVSIEKSAREKQYKKGDVLSFSEVEALYNTGISTAEKQAWVWYKRSLGEPMTGWEKYFLSGRGNKTRMLVTTEKTILRTQSGRVLRSAPTGTVLGKLIEADDESGWGYVRTFEGVRQVSLATCKIENSPRAYATERELFDLVKEGALFYLGGELVPYPVYAYGNMYDREIQLERDLEKILDIYGHPVLVAHREIIRQNKPRFLSITNPDPAERPVISVLSEYAEMVTVDDFNGNYPVDFKEAHSLRSAFRAYMKMLDHRSFNGTRKEDIWEYYVLGKPFRAGLFSRTQRKQIRAKVSREGERLFGEFLHRALKIEDQRRIDMGWNRLYNGQSALSYHRIPIGFSASAKFRQFNFHLRPAQREGVAFFNAIRSGINAYDVGVGKTMTAIVAVAEAIMTGRAIRPLIVVPNPTYGKWMGELIGYTDTSGEFVPGVLSYTGIRINDWHNLGKKYKDRVPPDDAVAGRSITLITHEGLRKIGFSDKVMDDMLIELVNILGQPSDGKVTERNTEIEYTRYEELIGIGRKGTVFDIDTLGFDMLVIDEAHRCKNVFDGVRKDKNGVRRYDISGSVSEIGRKAFFLCNYVQRTFGGNVFLLTATPFTNSPLEIFGMLSLVAMHSLQEMNIRSIHHFFNLFVRESSEIVVDMNGDITSKSVIKRFNNRLILQKLIYNHINYKTGEEAGIRRPCKINLPRLRELRNGVLRELPKEEQSLTYLRMTPKQESNQQSINWMIERGKQSVSFNPGMLFRALSRSLDNALSPFLFPGSTPPKDYREFVEGSPKILYCIRCIESVVEYHRQRQEAVSGQVVYMNRGKGFFRLIKEYLIKKSGFRTGVKWGRRTLDEVEIISSATGSSTKEAIKGAFLDGVVKVIIGTATIREGIDLQKRSTVLYNLFPDWNPTDIRQLEGRIWRQGNRHGFVRVVMPLVQDSMDVFVFQKLEEKTARINDIWYRAERGNVLDLESLDPEEIKFALISDPMKLASMIQKERVAEVRQELEITQANIRILRKLDSVISSYHSTKKQILTQITRTKNRLANSPVIKHPMRGELMKAMAPDEKKKVQEQIRYFGRIQKFLTIASPTDKEIIGLARYIRDRGEPGFDLFPVFHEAVAKIRAAERTVLKDRGRAYHEELEPLIQQLEVEEREAHEKIREIESPHFLQTHLDEVRLRKSKLKIAGTTVEERVKDFAALNYLMDYRASEVNSDNCVLPKPGARDAKVAILEDELELAKALGLRMKLLRLKRKRRQTIPKQT